jgi:transcriptional regulator with XRE-family HTH domain
VGNGKHGEFPVVSLFGAELASARTAAGLSQEALGERAHYSGSLIGLLETGRRIPSADVARALDRALATHGTFERLQEFARAAPLPSWFRPYAEIEATATQIRSWQPAFVDGLLQTEDYARALLSRNPNTSEADVDALVAARMERQSVLHRDSPPLLWIVLDEAVLHRRVASDKVMHDQLDHLADAARRPNVHVEVVPYAAGGHYALAGAFTLVQQADRQVGYVESVADGYIVELPAAVARMALAFDTVRGEAIPARSSRDLIERRAEEYGSD